MNVKVPSPLAVHLNSVLLPISAAVLCGGIVIVGGSTEWEGECHMYWALLHIEHLHSQACCNDYCNLLK